MQSVDIAGTISEEEEIQGYLLSGARSPTPAPFAENQFEEDEIHAYLLAGIRSPTANDNGSSIEASQFQNLPIPMIIEQRVDLGQVGVLGPAEFMTSLMDF